MFTRKRVLTSCRIISSSSPRQIRLSIASHTTLRNLFQAQPRLLHPICRHGQHRRLLEHLRRCQARQAQRNTQPVGVFGWGEDRTDM